MIDSGLDQNLTSLDNVDYYDATGGSVRRVNSRADGYGHGTHVAGLLGSNGFTLQRQLPRRRAEREDRGRSRCSTSNGQGATSDVINAVNFVVANRAALGVKVITMSLGHPIYEPAANDPLVAAVQNAVAKGIVVVVSAGNFGGNPETRETGYAGITSPGNAPAAITVGAVDTLQTDSRNDDEVAWYSSRGPTWYDGFQKPDVVAPGSHLVSNISTKSTIYRDYPNGIVKSGAMPFFKMSGTSMAAPVVAGVVADMLQAAQINGVTLTPNTVKAILQYTAIRVGNEDTLTQGAGQVNAAGAIALASAIKKNTASGQWWLSTPVAPYLDHRRRMAAVEPADSVGRPRARRQLHLHQRSGLGHRGGLGRSPGVGRPHGLGRQHRLRRQRGSLGQPDRLGRQPPRHDRRHARRLGRSHRVGRRGWSGATSRASASPRPARSGARSNAPIWI